MNEADQIVQRLKHKAQEAPPGSDLQAIYLVGATMAAMLTVIVEQLAVILEQLEAKK